MKLPPEKETPVAEFDRYADEYDTHMQSLMGDFAYYARQKARALRSAGILTHDCRVLDFGCGTGSLSAAIHAMDPEVRLDGFDVSRSMCARAAALTRTSRPHLNSSSHPQPFR